ncbi:hypothetical protein QZM82_31785 [Burkholderia cepacia]|uniref:hypothetical protein n=1 Tax=Burkholderia cepacia TaxID=292 RepID=UPI002654D3EE|nr:hypothetical protein [Burkholderia cepacia]MDN7900781.1 hypothetical protein [Burkholderia cepacia]
MKSNIKPFAIGTRGWYVAEAQRAPVSVARAVLRNVMWWLPISGRSAPDLREREPS